MCGFVGVIHSRVSNNILAELSRCLRQLNHRGPDSNGMWVDEECMIGLGHVRLSIVDLSPAGHQPMQSACGRFVMVFNGEIYNHLELRKALIAQNKAPVWLGHSDSETLLACFSVWGVKKTLQATVGMFAVALWDDQLKTITLARDRMGEKPLYWGWSNGALLFASELKALKAHSDFNANISRGALSLLLRYNYIPAPYSIYDGFQKLRAGHFVQIARGQSIDNIVSEPYWSLGAVIDAGLTNQFTGSDEQAIDILERQLSESVGLQMLADVPLGAFLSGGVDSSTIVAMMRLQSRQPVRTFAIGFNESRYNEAVYARAVAAHLGTEHTELYVGGAEALAVIPKLQNIYCEPFADSSQIPTFLVSQMAREKVAVSLSGDGGDELFGGYNSYRLAPRIWTKLKLLPFPLRLLASRALSGIPFPGKISKILRLFSARDQQNFYKILSSHWIAPDLAIKGGEILSDSSSALQCHSVDSFEHWMMALDTSQYMADDVLVKVDRAAMANSLETRVPLLDHRLVELAWQLPLHMKIRNGVGKWILREVLYRHVPRHLIERPKKGFSVPLGQWLRGPLRDWAENLLDERRLVSDGYFHPESISTLWRAHLSGKCDNSLKLWSVLMFQDWLANQ